MVDESGLVGKDLEGSGNGTVEVLFQHLPRID
jgi:hypothetical protein